MPPQNSRWLHQQDRTAPRRHDARRERHCEALPRRPSSAAHDLPLRDDELLAEQRVLGDELRTRANDIGEQTEREANQIVHARVVSRLRAGARSRRTRREAPCALGNAGDDRIEVTEHVMLQHPHRAPAQSIERALPRAVMPRALLVVTPIDLDDEPHLGAREVDDVLADDELTTKRKPGLRPREPAPEPLLRPRWVATHEACATFEERCASDRDKSTTVHEDLQEVGADARRVKPKARLA